MLFIPVSITWRHPPAYTEKYIKCYVTYGNNICLLLNKTTCFTLKASLLKASTSPSVACKEPAKALTSETSFISVSRKTDMSFTAHWEQKFKLTDSISLIVMRECQLSNLLQWNAVQMVYGRFAPSQDVSLPGRFAPWMFRPQDVSPPGRFATWTFRPWLWSFRPRQWTVRVRPRL